MEETTCPITGEKNAFFNEEADFYRYTLKNLCVNYRICKDLEIGDDEKTKLAGKLANFSQIVPLYSGMTFSKVFIKKFKNKSFCFSIVGIGSCFTFFKNSSFITSL